MVTKTAANSATVRTFLAILGSRITQYDKKLETKQPNIYRLGLLLEAKHKAEDLVRKHLDDSTPEALEALKGALNKKFQPDFPPVKAVVKMVDEFLQSGKMPKLASIVARFKEAAGTTYTVTVKVPTSHERKTSIQGNKLQISGLSKDDAESISKGFRNWGSPSYTADLDGDKQASASSVGKISDLLRDAVKPGEAGTAAKAELAEVMESKPVLDALELFLRAMKQANISVGEALAMMARY